MPNATKLLTSSTIACAVLFAGCSKAPDDQNIAIDSNSAAAQADTEILPADESSATATEDLADGTIDGNEPAGAETTNSD